MKKRWYSIVLLSLMVAMVSACAANAPEDTQNKPSPETSPPASKTSQPNTPVPVTPIPDTAAPDTGESMKRLLKMFPDRQGTQWIYSGFAEYGHDMKLDQINPVNDGGKEYVISGMVHDMSDGEAKGDFSLKLRYIFSGDSVREILDKGEKVPHKVKDFIILKLPLAKGNSWTQDVEVNGKKTELKAEILDVQEEAGTKLQTVKVRYTAKADGMPGGVYKETRDFKEGMGVAHFENTLNQEIDFNYTLYKIQ